MATSGRTRITARIVTTGRTGSPAVAPCRLAGPAQIAAGETGDERRWRVALAMLAVLSFALSFLVATVVFPYGSLNRDESTYVTFGDVVADGHLTLSAPVDGPFRPWASGVRDGRIVMKYTPPWPAALAAARVVTGERRVAPAAAAALATVLLAGLAREVLGDRRRALVAAGLFALSPIVVLQSGTFLSYVFQLALELGAVLLLLRGARAASVARLAGAGLLSGVALFARPFDAVLFVGPFAVVTLAAHRRSWPALVAPFVAGALAPGLAMLAYNAHTMGSPLSLPFNVTGGNDGFGFGRRSIFAGSSVRFTPADGLAAGAANLGWLAAWVAGGPVLVVVAAAGFRRVTNGAGKRGLVAVAAAFPLAYVFFWGTYALVHFWKGAAALGPFYHLPLVIPLVIFAAAGLGPSGRWLAMRLGRPERVGAAIVAAVMVAVTLAWLPPKLAVSRRVTGVLCSAHAVASGAPAPGVLLIPDRGDRGFDSWTPTLVNRPDLRQPVLYAEDRGPATFALLDRFPARAFSRLVASPTTAAPRAFRLAELAAHRAPAVTVDIGVALPAGVRATSTYVVEGRREVARPPDPAERTRWRIVAGEGPGDGEFAVAAAAGVLAFGAEGRDNDGVRQRFEVRVPYRVIGEDVELLGPGQGFRWTGRGWFEADMAGVIDDRYGP